MSQVRAIATLKLQRRAADVLRTPASPAAQIQAVNVAARAHAELLAAEITRFLERPATAVAVRMPAAAAPAGAPIGEPALDWLQRIEPPCSWYDGGRW